MSKPQSIQIKELQSQIMNIHISLQMVEKTIDEIISLVKVQSKLIKEMYKKEV